MALPLDDINAAAAREKSIRHGHACTLHLWWSRKPLAAARAVLFAQLVNDPGYQTGDGFTRAVNKKDAARERLFKIIRDLVQSENTNNEEVLEAARAEIRKSWCETCVLNAKHPDAATLFNPDRLPAFHDPFAGGGTIPLEAQRLGLESHASDLNPVAVLINKAMIELPPKFADQPPVGPMPADERQQDFQSDWPGATGLAEDVRRYGHWMHEEAQKRIGHLYPKVKITAEMAKARKDLKPYVGQELTAIAWLWARTVASPNPAFAKVQVPLASAILLSTKRGKEAWVEPVINADAPAVAGAGRRAPTKTALPLIVWAIERWGMRDKQLYQQILGIKSPWHVVAVDVALEDGEVRVRVEAKAGTQHQCPECGKRCAGYDRRRRRWRHLDTCQLKTILEAEVPRVQCSEHGVVMVKVPWAEPGSGFTALFEALVIDGLKEATDVEITHTV